MGNLHDISRRISSVASTRKITSTMEMGREDEDLSFPTTRLAR